LIFLVVIIVAAAVLVALLKLWCYLTGSGE
jgi:hypothetical protein